MADQDTTRPADHTQASTTPSPDARRGFFIAGALRNVWQRLLHLFFRLLYNELAWLYDPVAWLASRGQWTSWGSRVLPHIRGQCVLELGHGPGHLLAAMADQGVQPVGLDLSPNMGRQARRRMTDDDIKVPLVRARAQVLPFRSGSFDTIAATFPSEFIVDSRTLEEVRRALRSRGRLVIVVGAGFAGEGLASRILTWAYRVTGQDPPSPDTVVTWLERGGLSPRIVWEEVDGTSVMLAVADRNKPGHIGGSWLASRPNLW